MGSARHTALNRSQYARLLDCFQAEYCYLRVIILSTCGWTELMRHGTNVKVSIIQHSFKAEASNDLSRQASHMTMYKSSLQAILWVGTLGLVMRQIRYIFRHSSRNDMQVEDFGSEYVFISAASRY